VTRSFTFQTVATDLKVVYRREFLEALRVLQAQYFKFLQSQGRHLRDGCLREVPGTQGQVATDFMCQEKKQSSNETIALGRQQRRTLTLPCTTFLFSFLFNLTAFTVT